VSTRRRLLLSPLLLLVALVTVLTGGSVSAAAAHGSETRVRAIATVTVDAVGQPSGETAGHVGCLRPETAQLVSGSCVATEAASVPGAAQLADEVAGATGGTVKQLSNGYSITVPSGSRGIVVRVMEEGGGRTNYYRVSISGKEAFTVDGVASVDRALTHIDIGSSSLDEILRIIKAAGG
jgi:hypothetical protein